MSTYSLDFETYSEANIRDVGAYRYACDPSTEILMFAIAKDDEESLLWACEEPKEGPAYEMLLKACLFDDHIIYAHNAQFEAAICKYILLRQLQILCPKLKQWRCTAAMCRRAAIPSSLEKAGEFLGIKQSKQKEGKALIKKFSVPQKPTKKNGGKTRILPSDDLEAFKLFGEYCLQDVRAEREIHKKLKAFELKGAVLESFQFDMRMNDRGIPVNVSALENAQKFLDHYVAQESAKFREVTGLNPTQVKALAVWFQERGYPHKSLDKAHSDSVLDHPPEATGISDGAYKALKMKSLLSFAANSKINKMLEMVCPDGYIRGALLWSGAERTHRWAGRGIQPQNFRKATVPCTDIAYELICEDRFDPEAIEVLIGPPLETVASCVRQFIQPHEGLFLDADFSQVEARIVAWLCGQLDTLDAFEKGEPIYEKMGSKIFRKPVSEIGKNSIERFVGKQATLGCGFQMGAPKFKSTCENFGEIITKEVAERAVKAWREDNHEIVLAWRTIGDAAISAIRNPGKTYKGTAKISFCMTRKAGFPALVMVLPSGHKLIYPEPRLVPVWNVFIHSEVNKFHSYFAADQFIKKQKKPELSISESEEITFYGGLKNKGQWGRVSTYGGKLLENATQAIAGDLMAHGACRAEEAGFEICMLVHDQAIAPVELAPQKQMDKSVIEFSYWLCDLPEWAKGLPLEADGQIIPYYKK